MKTWEFETSCLWEEASISLAQCFFGLFICAQSFTFTADSSPTEHNAWKQTWTSNAFEHREKTAHKEKMLRFYYFLDPSVDFRCINLFNQIPGRISSGKDTLISCRVDASFGFRQLCNAQQIQCTKARLMGKQEGRGSMPVISNLSKYNCTMSHTASDHVHLYLQCLHMSMYGSCLWKRQSQKQSSSHDTEQNP